MATRNGKIANLPNDIREQLNLRLLDGETGRELAAWLNALPGVQSVLGSQFNGAPISEVNLTHWRQGGYLQWFTERECFDSARALAEGDCDLAKAGLTAERLLNILMLRIGQILLYWDISSDEGVSETAAFRETAKKARILQGITRSVLAIQRIQSQSASSKVGRKSSSPDSVAVSNAPSASGASAPSAPRSDRPSAPGIKATRPETGSCAAVVHPLKAPRGRSGGRSEILSGPISPSIPWNLSQTPFKADADLAGVLNAV
jgi:hypothetical protein